jgi:NAD(P)-dependent dehydrogenase (short-subunit alcohol dehydrogenase family)
MPSQIAAATRTIVMTGGTRGLGKVAATELLKRAPDLQLVLVARSSGTTVAAELREASGNPHVSSVEADLSSLDSIRAATAAIKGDLERGALPRLAGFVGNAGLQLLRASDATVDGYEATFAINVLANYVFVDELHEQFAAPARIVLTSSDTHFGDFRHNLGMVPAPRWQDPIRLSAPGTDKHATTAGAGRTAYATSKLAVIYLTHALAARLPAGVNVFSFNPGLVPGTGLARDGGPLTRFMFGRIMPAMTFTPYARTLKQSGADLAAAAIEPMTADSGAYVNGTTIERSSPESYDRAREDALWEELTRLSASRQ